MKNFKELKVWQKSMDAVTKVYGLTEQLPSSEKFGLISQINRSAVSIPSNIAEGNGRNSNGELKHFLGIALASSFELETQLLILNRLKMANTEKVEPVLSDVTEVQKMLSSFISKINNN